MTFRAKWILPIAGPPVRDGWVSVEQGRVTAVGQGLPPGPARDLGDVALLPGLVNAHTHLELSWMAGRVPPADSMDEWIRSLMRLRAAGPAGGDAEAADAMAQAASGMFSTGTTVVGDVSNSLTSVPVFARFQMAAVVFHEILGFKPADPVVQVRAARKRCQESLLPEKTPDVFSAVVAHAPYSTAPSLFTEIAARHDGPAPLSVHLAESLEEIEFLRTGTGRIRDMLESLGAWDEAWPIPRCGPVEYLRRVGYLRPGTLLVHCVHVKASELEHIRDAEAVVVTCPRSNVWVGGGVPPVARFYGAGIPVAIGTDSLASTNSLNLFDELLGSRGSQNVTSIVPTTWPH
jgi:cytosine/adenosine deaminase-related metal-dependent hydrolase